MKNPMPNLPIEELLKEDPRDMVPEAVESRMQSQFEAFHVRLKQGENQRQPLAWSFAALLRGRYSALATILALVVVGMTLGVMGVGSRPTLAFADVLKQIRTFRPYSYTETIKSAGEPDFSEHVLYWSLSRRRQERPDGTIIIFDLGSKPVRSLTLRPDMKLAVEKTLTGFSPTQDPNLLQILAEIKDGKEEPLGVREMEGRQATGFHLHQPESDWTVWADTRTGLPVRVELGQPSLGRTIVMSGFKFDEQFDETLFSTTAPAGYHVQKIESSEINATEQDLLEGLRAVARFMDGKFPAVFEVEGLRELLRRPNQPDAELKELATKTRHALRYIEMLKLFYKVKDLTYQGGGVKLGDAAAPIMWWLPQGTDKYRVIYGDLSARDVTPDKRPKANKAAAQLQAQAAPEAFHPYSFTQTVVMDNGSSSSERLMYLNLSRRRQVSSDGAIAIFDMSRKDILMLQLQPAQKKASLKTIPGRGPAKDPDLVAMVSRMQGGTEQDLGTRVIGGRQGRGFHAALPGNDFKVWVDQESGRPLLIELTHVGEGKKLIMSDFRFNETYDESLFSTAPPAGYTLEKAQ